MSKVPIYLRHFALCSCSGVCGVEAIYLRHSMLLSLCVLLRAKMSTSLRDVFRVRHSALCQAYAGDHVSASFIA